MERYFTFGNSASFRLFSTEHLSAMAVLIAIYALLYLKRDKLAEQRTDRIFRLTVAAALILQEVTLNIWRLSAGIWSAADSLPFHLCGLLVIACPVMLVTKSYRIYEIAYFLGLGGASQAILTPDLGAYGFPHFRFYQFFVSHGLIIFAVLYMTFVHKYKPSFKSFLKAFTLLNALLPVIGVINRITGGNYFFIARKPETASIIDYLGPWPWYIIYLELIGFLLLLLPYIPVAAGKMREASNQKHIGV